MSRVLLLIATAAALTVGSAQAQTTAATTASSPPVITSPVWLRKPSGEDFAAVLPERAASKGISGRAIIRCTVNRDGYMTNCKIVEETPPGMGFGRALMRVSNRYQMSTTTVDGASTVGGVVEIPLTVQMH